MDDARTKLRRLYHNVEDYRKQRDERQQAKQFKISSTKEEMADYAEKILAKNPDSSLANRAKARTFYADGDFGNMIPCKEKAIAYAKYSLDEYLDYFDMLAVGISLYTQNGDQESADYCREKLLEIPDMLEKVKEGTSSLGWKIKDQPELELPKEYKEQLSLLK